MASFWHVASHVFSRLLAGKSIGSDLRAVLFWRARRRDGAFWKLMDPQILETQEVSDVRVPRFWILGIFGTTFWNFFETSCANRSYLGFANSGGFLWRDGEKKRFWELPGFGVVE